MYWCVFFGSLIIAALIGYWYRGWKHNITIEDGEGEYPGG